LVHEIIALSQYGRGIKSGILSLKSSKFKLPHSSPEKKANQQVKQQVLKIRQNSLELEELYQLLLRQFGI
jgi:hypothetical protein